MTQSFCVKIEGPCEVVGPGARGLFTVEGAEGARTSGEATKAGDAAFDADIFGGAPARSGRIV